MGSQTLPEVPLRCSSLERENRLMDRDNLDLNDPSAGNNRLTACGRNRGSGRNLDPKYLCQICEDIAVGYHCGAFICEACKKFYLRCMKSGLQSSFTCAKSKTCEINKDTRSHCQFCRFQKCIQVGMYKSGRNESKTLKVDFSSIPCKVCDAPSSGFHFGSITCEGCKGFFRRTVNEDSQHPVVCVSGGNCLISNSNNRVACKACRFARCKAVGMTLAGTRLGRQSNSVKRTTILQYNLERQAAAAAQAGGAPPIAVVNESSNANLMPEDGESKGDENIVEPTVSGRKGGKKTSKVGRSKKKSQDDSGGMLAFEEGDLNLLSEDLAVDAVSIAKRHEIEAFLNRSDMQQWNASNELAARPDAQVIGKLEAGFRGGEVVHSTPPVPLPSYWKTAASSFDNPALPPVDNFEWFPRKPVGDSYRLEESRGSGITAPSATCDYSSSRPYGQPAPNSVGYYGLLPGVMQQQQQAYNVRTAPAPQQFVPAARGVPLEPPFGTEERLWQEPRMYEAARMESSLLDNAADRGRHRFTYSEVEQNPTRLHYAAADVRRYYAGDEEKMTPYEVSPFANTTTPYGVNGQDIWAYPKVEPHPVSIEDTGKAWQQTAVPHPSTAPFQAPSHVSEARVDGSSAPTAAAAMSYRHSIDLTSGVGYNLDLSTRGLSVAHSIDSILTQPVVANIATESNVNRSRNLSGDQDKVVSPEERKTLIQFTAKRAAIRPPPPLASAECDVKNVPKLPVNSCLKTEQTVVVPPVVIKTEVDEQPLCLVSPTSIEPSPLTTEIKSPATSDVSSNHSPFNDREVDRCVISPGEGDSSSQGYLSGEDGTASSSGVGSPYVKELHEAVLDMPAFQDIQILRERLARAWHVLDCIIIRPIELEEYKPDYENRSSVWNLAALSFMHHIKSVLKFVKQVPGFTSLPVEDQIIMVQISSYPLSLLYHTQFYNLETGECNFFINTLEEYEFVMLQFPHFRGLVHHFQHTGQMLKTMNLTDVEYGLMAVIALFLAGVKPYEKTVQVLINFFTDMLLEYCEETSDDPCRGGKLLLRLGELYKFNCDHLSIAMKSSAENPDVDFSQLWHEMFLDY